MFLVFVFSSSLYMSTENVRSGCVYLVVTETLISKFAVCDFLILRGHTVMAICLDQINACSLSCHKPNILHSRIPSVLRLKYYFDRIQISQDIIQ